METLLTAIDNCPGGARYGCAEEQMDRWIDTLTSAAKKLEAEVRHYRFACLGMEKEIAEYRLAEKERNKLELAEIQETEKLHKENEKLKEENEELRPIAEDYHRIEKRIDDYQGSFHGHMDVEVLVDELEELKDFSNWENHPALKHKVVLDDDFYLSHLYEDELIDPDDYKKLKEDLEKALDEGQDIVIDKLEDENEKLKEENDVLQKFIAGNFHYEPQVKALISRDWEKEFIENNQERWEEVGLDWGSDDV
jgi:cell division protein FtsB